MASLPFTVKTWWEKNYPILSLGLALPVLFHYLVQLKNPAPILHTGLDYLGFMALIGALFVISGGIHITVKGEATPMVNLLFLLAGGILANFLGTAGASMVLIRPWIRMNKYRITTFHTVFFILIVSNAGGALTPLGDPPLFLGYLKGVPFFWVIQKVWPIWTMAMGLLLGFFYIVDTLNFKRAPLEIRQKETRHEEWKFQGLHNLLFLGVVIAAVFVQAPPFLREALMLGAAALSYKTTSRAIHASNDFDFSPIKEVAILFASIFVTMLPALEWTAGHAVAHGIRSSGQFYWACGILSSILDNAPTYMNFLSAAAGLSGDPSAHGLLLSKEHTLALVASHPQIIKAISVSSVFFGALTYIGNGPNLLVKAIAERSKVPTPSFSGYFFSYSLPVLMPVLVLIWFFFFRA